MPFRERAKNLFKTKSRGSSISKPSSTTSDSGGSPDGRWPSNVYKPGEPMPRPKYRAVPKKEHKDKLEAFNFADSWRKKSFQSVYSPMGTRAPSRRASFLSFGKKSATSRNTSISSAHEGPERSGLRARDGHAAVATRLSTEVEQYGDDDVGNVGLSRVQSKDRPVMSRPRTAEDVRVGNGVNGLEKTASTAHDHQPFSERELAMAMQKTRLEVPAQS